MILLTVALAAMAYAAVETQSEVSPYGECFDQLRPAFIRIAASAIAHSDLIAKTDMVTCAFHCRRNSHPSSDAVYPCRGFNFRPGRSPVCEFFSMKEAAVNIEHRQLSYYYEKTCLKIPSRCEEAAFAADARHGVRLKTGREIRAAHDRRTCIEACFLEECQAFEWDNKTSTCSVYVGTKKDSELERAENVTYYENNCLQPSSRCPSGEVSFLVARRSDVPSFGVSVGTRTVRNCMRECIETTLFHCKSFQLDAVSQECFVSDESSDVAVPSASLDLFEPFCLAAQLTTDHCNRPYTFEKILTTKMTGATAISKISNSGVESCLSACLAEKHCRSVNYDVATRTCHVLDKLRGEAVIGPDENFDYYESACPTVTVTPPPTAEAFSLLAKHRTHRQEFRHVQNMNVNSVRKCWRLCSTAAFLCESFSYSLPMVTCTLSSTVVRSPNDDEHTQPSQLFDLYTMNISPSTTQFPSPPTLSFPSSRFPTLATIRPTTDATTTAQLQTTTESADSFETHNILDEDNIFAISSTEFIEAATTHIPIALTRSSTSAPETTTTRNTVEKHPDIAKNTIGEVSITSAALSSSSEDPVEPHYLPSVVKLPSDDVAVKAQCHPHGINITFAVKGNYSGAVYAAERFEQCRVFVTRSSNFAIFIPRPRHNSWCNAIEVNNSMSVMLVVSNDRIVPLDVTTLDDLFYHVACNYTQTQSLNRLKQGIVVGGPSLIAIPKVESRSIGLRITRKGQPVENVYIGETLVARVESHLPASSLRVVDCSAVRVGGTGRPASVHLIADGCALLPSLMSSMILGHSGWEATLSAFRLDGSEHVDIVCMVAVCKDKGCQQRQPSCPPSKDRSIRSPMVLEPVRVDSRLRVRGERRDEHGDTLPKVCVQPVVYLSVALLLAASLVAVALSICSRLRQSGRDRRTRELLNHPLPESTGQKYVKTISL